LGIHKIIDVQHAERLIEFKIFHIDVDRADTVLFVKNPVVRPAIIAKVAHFSTDIQVMTNYVDEPICDISNAPALSSALDELSLPQRCQTLRQIRLLADLTTIRTLLSLRE